MQRFSDNYSKKGYRIEEGMGRARDAGVDSLVPMRNSTVMSSSVLLCLHRILIFVST